MTSQMRESQRISNVCVEVLDLLRFWSFAKALNDHRLSNEQCNNAGICESVGEHPESILVFC